MGYTSRVTGDIRIDPPLPWSEIRNSPYLPGGTGFTRACVRFILDETTVDTDEGVLTKRSAIAIEACTSSHKHYEMQDAVNEIVTQHEATFTGYFELTGEDGEQWRLAPVDRGDINGVHIERFEPTITWPAEAEGKTGGAA